MINHARTLLLNVSDSYSNGSMGAEYISEDFSVLELPNYLKNIRSTLFGSDPELVYLNSQVNRLIQLVSATDYEPYLYKFDPRKTYNTEELGSTFLSYNFSFVNKHSVYTDVATLGKLQPDVGVGALLQVWTIGLVKDTSWTAIVTNLKTRQTATTVLTTSPEGAYSSPIAVPGQTAKMSIKLDAELYVSGYSYNATIVAVAHPPDTLNDVISKVALLGGDLTDLFGRSAVEPYMTFYGLWGQDESFPDKVAGLTLALIWRMNELL